MAAPTEHDRWQDQQTYRLQLKVSDIEQRLDTLQTRWWKRAWFRINGWPGQRDLNAERAAWRPWRRWVRP